MATQINDHLRHLIKLRREARETLDQIGGLLMTARALELPLVLSSLKKTYERAHKRVERREEAYRRAL